MKSPNSESPLSQTLSLHINGSLRSKDMLGTVLNGIINSGQLYRTFTQREITEIQQLRQFFDPNLETTFVSNRINEYKEAKNYAGALQFANHLETQIKQGIVTLTSIAKK